MIACLAECAADGGFTDGQTPGHFVITHALLEPTFDEGAVAAVELGMPARRRLGLQAGAAVLGVACFPTALSSHRMTKGVGDLDLRRQLTEAQGHSHEGQMDRIVKRNTIENLMTTEDNTIAIPIVKPQDGIDRDT